MPAVRPYKVFISHGWEHHDEYGRVEQCLNDAPDFAWENLSVPSHTGIRADDTNELLKFLRSQMRPADVILILCGMYGPHRDWIDFEIGMASYIERPILGILPRGGEPIPDAVVDEAVEMVGWSTGALVAAIRRHAIPELLERGE